MKHIDYNALLVDQTEAVAYITDLETYELLYLNKMGMQMYGIESAQEYQGKKCYEVLHGTDKPCSFCTHYNMVEEQKYRREHHNEKLQCWFDVTVSMVWVEGRPLRVEIARDITARKEAVSLLSVRLSMEDVLFRCLNTLTKEKDFGKAIKLFLEAVGGYYQADRVYILEFDLERQILDDSFEWRMPGVGDGLESLGNISLESLSDWIEKFKKSGDFSINLLDEEGDHGSREYRILSSRKVQSLMAVPLLNEGKIVGLLSVEEPREDYGNLVLLRSIAEFVMTELERRRLFSDLEYLSYTDTLTGLWNRHQYNRMMRGYESNMLGSIGVIAANINGLKNINNTYGHKHGDYVLQQTAKILRKRIAGNLFRIGGDEFVALCDNIEKAAFQEMVSDVRRDFQADQNCDVSFGCVWKSEDINVPELLQQANELMFAEKQSYYSEVLQHGYNSSRTGSSAEVLHEIEEGRFIVHYQPQINLCTGKIMGAEALVRKLGDDGKIIPPVKFIPYYEAAGVIRYVDLHVLEMACASMKRWHEHGYDLLVAVNFSRLTLMEPGIVKVIRDICAKHEVRPSSVTIEVTESISKMQHDHLQNLIKELKAEGFSISLDDFGSSYSNLAILSAMDFDEIKFDRSLVQDLENNRKSQAVLKHSIKMCQSLEGSHTIAEGIETLEQFKLLKEYSCDHGQGYYFSRPIAFDNFTTLLKEEKSFLV